MRLDLPPIRTVMADGGAVPNRIWSKWFNDLHQYILYKTESTFERITASPYQMTNLITLLVFDSASPITVNIIPATGTLDEYKMVNVNTGRVTLVCSGTDTLNGDPTQYLDQWDGILIHDYATGTWVVD